MSPQSVRLSVYLSVCHSVRLSDNCFCFFVLCLRDSVLVCLILSLFLSNFHFANFSLSLSRFSVCLSLSPSLSLSVCLSLSLSLSLSGSLSLSLCRSLSVFVAVCLSLCCLHASVGQSAVLPVISSENQSTNRGWSAYPPLHQSVCLLNVCLFVCVSLSWHVRLSVVGCVSFCLPMHVHMWACLSVRFSPCFGGARVAWGGGLGGWRGPLLVCLFGCLFVCLIVLCVWCVCVTFVCRFSYGFMFVCAGVCMCGKGMCMCVNVSVYVYIHK